MRDDNLNLGCSLAKYVNKKYGVITYSGTLAIELALISLDLKPNSNVLVSSEVCSSIINTINKLNLNPIILTPYDGMILHDNDIDSVINENDVSCILLVHQYGIFNKISKNKYQKMGIKIIEDIAQAWICNSSYYDVGINSDIVITSFGQTKPLNNGIGGAIFFDDKSYINKFDFCDIKSRNCNNVLYSYLLPTVNNISLKKLLNNAKKNLYQQKKFAKMYNKLLINNEKIKLLSNNLEINNNSWHRFPIYFEKEEDFFLFLELAEKYDLEYQTQHKIKTVDLPSFKNNIKYDNFSSIRYYVLLRTRKINYLKQKRSLKKIIHKLGKQVYVCYNKYEIADNF